MPFEGAASFRWRPWLCQALSVALHGAFFLAGGFLLTVAAEFGVDAGTGGHAPTEPQEMHAEVEIVEYETTPKVLPVVEEPVVTEEPVAKDEPVIAEEPSIQEEVQEPEMPPVPEPSPTATPEPIVAQEADQWAQPAPVPTPIAKPPRRKAVASGTPSSSTRREKAAVQSRGGGERSSVGSCGLLAEPSSGLSRRSETKSTTRSSSLSGRRERAGQAESVTLIKSSGHRLLDNSALEAVRKWKFHPATIGGVKVSSTVKVPVRFRLD